MLYPAELWTQNVKATAEKRTRGVRGGAGLVKHPKKGNVTSRRRGVRRRGEEAPRAADRRARPHENQALIRREHAARAGSPGNKTRARGLQPENRAQ